MSEGMASSPMRCSAYMKLLWKLTCHLTGLLLRRIMIPRRYVASTGERVPQVRSSSRSRRPADDALQSRDDAPSKGRQSSVAVRRREAAGSWS